MARVLVITDDPDFFSLLGYVLQAEGFLASRVIGPGDTAIDEHADPAIVILDTSENTLETCRSIMSSNKQPAAVIALVRSDSADPFAQLPRAGVAVCLTRPFGLSHLLAILRKVTGIAGQQRPSSRLQLDRLERTVTWKDRTVRLSPIEFGLFADLYQHYGTIRLRTDLLAAGWSLQPRLTDRRVDVQVCRLRRTLAPFGETFIETIRSSGYKLLVPPDN